MIPYQADIPFAPTFITESMTEVFLDSHRYQLYREGEDLYINGQKTELDIHSINEHQVQVLHQNRSYDIFIHQIDKENGEVLLSINGKQSKVKVQSRIQKLLKELGLEGSMAKKLDNLKAPMPGLIHSIKTQVGEEVKKGDPLLILEAMKMENVLKSPGEGRIASIHVQEKQSVEKSELLISFE